jgi:hypothetical protein
MKKIIGMCALLLAGTANASLIELEWTTTALSFTGTVPGLNGEIVTTSFTVDNGGSTTLSQSWSQDDFVSYRIEGASGWWIQSDDINIGSSGFFSTDELGNVMTAGNWLGDYFNDGTIMTSWAGSFEGGWWNNGNNEVVCSTVATHCVSVVDVSENRIGSSWKASQATAISESSSIPEPISIVLLGLGLAGIGFTRKNKT